MSILRIFLISLAAVFAENIVFTEYLGLEPFFKETKTTKVALRTGIAITIFTTASSFVTGLFDFLVLRPLSIEYMRTIVFVLVIAVMWRIFTSLKTRISLPSSYVFSSTAVLGVSLIISSNGFNPLEAIVYGFFAGAGFTLSGFLFAEIRKHLEYVKVPKFLEGIPILLIVAGLIALVFTGFSGLKFM